mmetsp:Transcript_11308/g.22250  ORF Transcript_11308/g.22250 Transcript_11308/m.22250 type:complete len:155 (-) Transcript_11308:465-929(-)
MEADFEDPANDSEQEVAPIEPKKPRVPRKALLNEERLISERGLKLLYEAAKSFEVKDGGRKDLARLMSLYKDWHFQLASRITFENFLKKCRTLGSKPSVRAHMNRIRLVHEGYATWADFENMPEEPELDLKRKHDELEAEESLEQEAKRMMIDS